MAESVSLSKCRSDSKIVGIFPKHFYLLYTKMFTFHVAVTQWGARKAAFVDVSDRQ